jgi:hypothetical protein
MADPATKDTGGAARAWRFVKHPRLPERWTWRLVASDGAIVSESEQFNTYGDAVGDAIRKGFRPSDDHWIVESLQTTQFHPRANPTTVPKTEADRAAAGSAPFRE